MPPSILSDSTRSHAGTINVSQAYTRRHSNQPRKAKEVQAPLFASNEICLESQHQNSSSAFDECESRARKEINLQKIHPSPFH